MLEVNLGTIVNSKDALIALSNAKRVVKRFDTESKKEVEDFVPLDMGRAYRVSKLLSKCDSELKEYDKVRQEKVSQYGTDVEREISGQKQTVKEVLPENFPLFIKEHNELISQMVKIDMEPLKIDDYKDVNLDGSHMMMLMWAFQE